MIDEMIEQLVGTSRPLWEIMRRDEISKGNTVIVPGDRLWLSADDWDSTIIVSQKGREIRLIAILARDPGTGAFRRTVTGILGAGLVPVIIEPMGVMAIILRRWNWSKRIVGSGFMHREEQWRPRKGWNPQSSLPSSSPTL